MCVSNWKTVVRLFGAVLTTTLLTSCVRNPPEDVPDAPPPPPPADTSAARPTPAAPEPPPPPPPSPPPISGDNDFASRSLEELNRDSPLGAVFFDYDSSELSAGGRAVLDDNAQVLRQYATWVITIEGHCDERGTPEYNLGLGERRALVAREYLLTLGLDADRVRTVSYGKEFPFDPAHTEEAWAANRRAHFVITER